MENDLKGISMKIHFSLILLALITVSALGQDQTPSAPAPASVEAIRAKIDAANVSLPSQVTEVVKMSQAGVSEKTILTYIDSGPGFTLNANNFSTLYYRGV